MSDTTEVLTRGVLNVIPNKEALQKKLESGEKLNIYLGIDPTATRIHLGHAVSLHKLQAFAEAGHHVTFVIGDFTALIGDTSDKDTERPILTREQIEANFHTYKEQAQRVLDFSIVEVKYNSEWLHKLTFEQIIKLCTHFSVGDFNSRELIRKRLDEGKRVGLHEFLYPVMQGYDSYHLNTDLQIGGADQTFSMQAGRTLIKDLRNKESFVLSTDFLLGTDGRKMSKSWGNAIWLDDPPEDMYAKIMAVDDNLIVQYYTLATEISQEEIEKIKMRLTNENPMLIKKDLAYQIVAELYDEEKAQHAKKAFEERVQGKNYISSEIETVNVPKETMSIETLLIGLQFVADKTLIKSRNEAKRLVEQGGVYIDEKRITDPGDLITVKSGTTLRIGKKVIIRLEPTL